MFQKHSRILWYFLLEFLNIFKKTYFLVRSSNFRLPTFLLEKIISAHSDMYQLCNFRALAHLRWVNHCHLSNGSSTRLRPNRCGDHRPWELGERSSRNGSTSQEDPDEIGSSQHHGEVWSSEGKEEIHSRRWRSNCRFVLHQGDPEEVPSGANNGTRRDRYAPDDWSHSGLVEWWYHVGNEAWLIGSSQKTCSGD